MKRDLFSTIFIFCGISIIAIALFITGRNFWTEYQAGEKSEEVINELIQQIPSEKHYPQNDPFELEDPEADDSTAPEKDTILEPYVPMPEIDIDEVSYIGYLEIPALELTLPVISQSTKEHLEIAPCRFYGTAYQNNLVIGGHRYSRHFRRINTLSSGDEIRFIDVTGNVFIYEVFDLETLRAYQAEYLCSGDWDLTLYTCTVGGYSRVAVRCVLK